MERLERRKTTEYQIDQLVPPTYNPNINRYSRVLKFLSVGFVIGLVVGGTFGLLMASGLSSLQSLAVKSATIASMGAVGALLGVAVFGGIEEITKPD